MRTIQDDELKRPGLILISRRQLLSIVPLSDRTIYNMEKRGDFPKRIALTSRNVAWDLGEVKAWIEGRKASGGQAARPGQTLIVS
jgi:prophage regulatory protein